MTSITFLKHQYDMLAKHLLPGDGQEALAFCLARQVSHGNNTRLIVNKIHLVPYETCVRTKDNIEWRTRDIVHILDEAEFAGLSIIKIHSHPNGPRAFSIQDNRSDSIFFPDVRTWCGETNIHCSVVFTPDFIFGRFFDKKNKAHSLDKITVIGRQIKIYPNPQLNLNTCGYDDDAYGLFKLLRIGSAGASGTGGLIAEELGRFGVKEIVISDHDFLSKENLPRIVNSQVKLIGKNKAMIAATSILKMGLGSLVCAFDRPLQALEVIKALRVCDVIFGCTDSVLARFILNALCTYYSIPYFDIGVHIEVVNGKLEASVGGFHYIRPGKSSLQSRGVYSAKELADETIEAQTPEYFERLKAAGYVKGKRTSRPAVIAINGVAATRCFEEFQAHIMNIREDESCYVAAYRYCARSGEVFSQSENEFRPDPLLGGVGLGDIFLERFKDLFFEDGPQPDGLGAEM